MIFKKNKSSRNRVNEDQDIKMTRSMEMRRAKSAEPPKKRNKGRFGNIRSLKTRQVKEWKREDSWYHYQIRDAEVDYAL